MPPQKNGRRSRWPISCSRRLGCVEAAARRPVSCEKFLRHRPEPTIRRAERCGSLTVSNRAQNGFRQTTAPGSRAGLPTADDQGAILTLTDSRRTVLIGGLRSTGCETMVISQAAFPTAA